MSANFPRCHEKDLSQLAVSILHDDSIGCGEREDNDDFATEADIMIDTVYEDDLDEDWF